LGKYQELIDHRLQGEISAIIETLQSDGGFLAVDQQLKNSPTINMLNTKYIIYNPQAQPILNPYANGNAWFPQKIEWVENANEEMARIGEVNSKTTSVIDQRYKNEIGNIVPSGFVGNSIQLTEYQPNYLKYESTTTSKQLAVFSEMYYNKGWNAYIDGEWVPHYRVDYTLRGLVIPEGKHVVEFKFLPKSYFTGEKFALVGSILLVLALIGIIGKELKFYFRKDDEQA
jgi:hypothetical protein